MELQVIIFSSFNFYLFYLQSHLNFILIIYGIAIFLIIIKTNLLMEHVFFFSSALIIVSFTFIIFMD